MREEQETLRGILERLLLLHNNMLPLLEEERVALVKNKPKDLVAVLRKKEVLVEAIKKEDHQRHTLVVSLSHALGIPSESITLSFLAERWQDLWFIRLKDTFSQVLDEIRKRQESNNVLIQTCQEIINQCINLLYSSPSDSSYDPQGNIISTDPLRGHLDKKI